MLRRSIFEHSRRRCFGRDAGRVNTQIPTYLSSRKEFSTASQTPKGPGPIGKPTETKSNFSKVIIGSVFVGAASLAAYQASYSDQVLGKKQHSSFETSKIGENYGQQSKDAEHTEEPVIVSNVDEPNRLSPDAEHTIESLSTQAEIEHSEAITEGNDNSAIQVEEKSISTPEEAPIPIEEKQYPEHPLNYEKSEGQTIESGKIKEGALGMTTPDITKNEGLHASLTHDSAAPEANDANAGSPRQATVENMAQDALGNVESPNYLTDAYGLKAKDDTTSIEQETNDSRHYSREEEALIDTEDAYVSKDGKLVLDFLQAIHAAEKRQAELDADVFGEEKRMLKEKYEKELKDARARQLMYAEEAAILDKELSKERTKAEVAIKSLQEKAEAKLRMELEQKENEAELERKKIQDFAKAELAASIAREKALQIEEISDAYLKINALRTAFYARSEEARQSHTIHKLALGALALEDALSRGLPIQKQLEALHAHLEDIDKDPLIDLVLSSIPDETKQSGADTLLQLNQKFDSLKGTLRHFSLIPPGGGGILTHSAAHLASALKVEEADQSGDGIESVINRVKSYLAEGKLVEAAECLEEGVKGSQAAEVVGDWVKLARNRAISEQALTLLQSYATSISLT